jgi:tetratricopeptide (TPR) repeat protein
MRTGDVAQAIECFATVLAGYPDNARIWMAYGDALKTAGRQAEAIAAYRRSCQIAPGFGEAWWSLSNLKTVRFGPADVEAMQAQLSGGQISSADRTHFHFALGKTFEDSGRFAESFAQYAEGNRLRRAGDHYQAAAISAYSDRMRSLYTAGFFAERKGWGHDAPDPIFIVGLPRSGLTHEDLRGLGERYLRQTRVHRKTDAPFFIDKMPNNWLHVGLIHLMLPRARIIDARRHPMACCFSCFKQHFARGQQFTYSLEDIGQYYRDYVSLMTHFDAVLPGRVHRVCYERLVGHTETEVRRLLAYCGLSFEESCLRFHETERPVSTASSEQVRQPVYREALDQWRNYEPWLQPLRHALGPAVEIYETESSSGDGG